MTPVVAMACVTLCAAAVCFVLHWAHRNQAAVTVLDIGRRARHRERVRCDSPGMASRALLGFGSPRLSLLAFIWAAWLIGTIAGGREAAMTCAVCFALLTFVMWSRQRTLLIHRLTRQTRALTRDLCLLATGGETAIRCVHQAAERSAEPLREQLLAVIAAVQAGTSLHQAMLARAELLRLAGYRDLLQVVWLHSETGASFAGMLAECVSRDEETDLVWGELDAKMGEARWTALILALVPVAVVVYMIMFSPFSLRSVLQDPAGRYACAAAAVLWALGIVVCRRLQMPPADFGAGR